MLKVAKLQDQFPAATKLYRFILSTRRCGGIAYKGGGATSQLDLPSLTPLSLAGCGRLQLRVPHWATSKDYCKWLIIDLWSIISTWRLLAIEDLTFFLHTFYIHTGKITSIDIPVTFRWGK